MLLTLENIDEFRYENENARIMIMETLKQHPDAILIWFKEIIISENIALKIWITSEKEKINDRSDFC